ncbi:MULTISPECIES: hypothetical protein [unclassified Streptomyces]
MDEAARHGLAVRLVHSSRWERCERRLPAASTALRRKAHEAVVDKLA